ncbi:MAG: thioredoxin-dependent thiol peroxidase [Candidatus Goldbacteria bacterium]|nr:thioredoxin-dependent thiol peroxidase [Candidatus Goldiibacteriota bacterium]
MLSPGEKAPDFCLNNQDSEQVCLKDFKGKWVVLYFYPKDDTPGCTIEAKSFSKENPDFTEIDAVILGVSADDCGSHKTFAEKYGLNILLLSDPDKKVLKKYGVWGEKVFMGRKFMGIKRTTYLINPKGRISYVWENVKPENHAIEVKSKLIELKEVEKWQ